MEHDKSFLGRGWGFPPTFHPRTRAVRTVAAETDIQESLRILMATSPGERIMQPAYGCGLKSHVFDGINESSLTAIKDTIRRAVLFFEPRIALEDVEIDATLAHEGVLHINLVYTVRTTNTRTNLVYPFCFLEGTDVRA